ncbi:acyl-CoA thioesterase/bile acid-CoA:amino acid N-acyltransferase family protein [Cellulosimicrobium marinum]|uniref:acyl-CoA thioesterase/bile acid-CoA:amino acid N-acyltransferase family protein n=1 Tax=Cellulosimicrobium marinum TaxID=1638992 RepID=UPI001E501C10|nr:acyl-CoA thioesterase/bile acid-CoA:amino acid N-acyltransferase family protein [Cellulosimicrobium marinum]MCB7137990.1 acyl-CoA thioesterase/BAAT N-terminal domain-containing protein [Cellulosimicrobium marinum]
MAFGRRTRDLIPALMLGVAVLGSCTVPPEPTIEVTEVDGPFAPLDVALDDLAPGAPVTLTATAVVDDARFRSQATFEVPDDGRIDLAATAPTSGDWDVADPMAPLWAMRAGSRPDPAAWDGPVDVELAVTDADGEPLATTTVARPGSAPGVVTREVTDGGLVAEYAVPADLDDGERRPAVLAFGGSEGGLGSGAAFARWLAGLGYPALGISYFRGPGQPADLEEVPVEPFLDALAWLHAQPEVDPEAVVTFGASRGGEMALWLAAEHPDLVGGAVAPTGSGYVVCGYPDASVAAWTLDGAPLTDTCPFDGPDDLGRAEIDVAAVDGPVVLACGTADPLWDACAYARDVVERRGPGTPTAFVEVERAGHFVAWAPYVPYSLGAPGEPEDGDPGATHAARVALWEEVVDLLTDLEDTA